MPFSDGFPRSYSVFMPPRPNNTLLRPAVKAQSANFAPSEMFYPAMTGIYIHIPFCKTRCDYCAFYSTTLGAEWRERYVARLCAEAAERREESPGGEVSTIYIGGGTPSQLSVEQLARIFETLYAVYHVSPDAEVTIEVNPDDITEPYVAGLAQLPINRISMGVQSFDDSLLRRIHRRHTAAQAIEAYRRLRKYFHNISIDLIYALPGEDLKRWTADIDRAVELAPEHISAYALSYEEGTPLTAQLQAGRVHETDEETYISMYNLLVDRLTAAGYEIYEISNLCRPSFRARHNSSYWHGVPYIGLGAGAHSYDGDSRRINLPDVRSYAESKANVPCRIERLSDNEKYDEMVMTRLRTSDGLLLSEVERCFGAERKEYLLAQAASYIRCGKAAIISDNNGEILRLTRDGIYIADEIIADLMCPD